MPECPISRANLPVTPAVIIWKQMKEITNRSALTVLPRKPFNERTRLYNELTEEELEERLKQKHVYLIEWSYNEENISDVLEPYYREIFEYELSSWNSFEHEWPQNRDIRMFLEWFEVKFNGDLFDLENGPIISEKL